MEKPKFEHADPAEEIYRFFGAGKEDATPAQELRAEACYRAFSEEQWDVFDKMMKDEEDRKHREKIRGELSRRLRT